MSHSWNHWACIVDENIEKKSKEIEEVERQNQVLLRRVERLENATDSLKRTVGWLRENEKKMNKERHEPERKKRRVESQSGYAMSSMMSFSARGLCDAGDGS